MRKKGTADTTSKADRKMGDARPSSGALHREVKAIGVVVAGLLLLLAVFAPGALGRVGSLIHGFLLGLFGFGAFVLPIALVVGAVCVLLSKKIRLPWILALGLFTAVLTLLHIIGRSTTEAYGVTGFQRVVYVFNGELGRLRTGGGIYGLLFGDILYSVFGHVGSFIILVAIILILSVLITGRSFIYIVRQGFYKSKDAWDEHRERREAERLEEEREEDERLEREARGLPPLPTRGKKIDDDKARNLDINYEDDDYDGEVDLPMVRLLQEEMEEPDEVVNPAPAPLFGRVKPAAKPMATPEPARPRSAEVVLFPEKASATTPKESIKKAFDAGMDDEPYDAEYDDTGITLHGLVDGADQAAPHWEEPYIEPAAPTAPAVAPHSFDDYELPPIDLLARYEAPDNAIETRTQILDNSRKLEETLKSFKVEAKVVAVSVGPTVTRYDIAPGPGVKVSAISNLSNDLALALAAQGIRIEAPIPGKSAVGIEIPNREPQPVFLRDILDCEKFTNFPSKLAFAVGKDIAGEPVVTDIARMPHLLIAGATGSGKSVCINTLIASILYNARPDEVKLLMIDPKVVELSVYNGIPHLLIPVVTEPKKASGALSWAVAEMETRYNLFAETGNRDLAGYNHWLAENDEPTLPQIVIIIDELADLMMVAKGEVEESICRLAQKARAAGLHLIVATQRPSVDVITGLIKANIPSRLAFAVSSGTDSRTVLDMYGAEKLLGKGDMLFLPMGQNKPIRVQGGYISDKEVEQMVGFLRTQTPVNHSQEMIEQVTSPAARMAVAGGDLDEFFHEAVEFLLSKGKASTSVLQRQFRIGYNRASRLMEDLEKRGIVGPEDGVKPRKITITRSEYLEVYKNE
ncbi:MAG: DNA translocase FtsK [Defluviitaleaceae bacterium]|nr:DNA translocase FtsK [Defluviitaleaceae bacterium]